MDKPQKNLRIYDVRLSDISRREGRLGMKFGAYGSSRVYRSTEKEQ